jgi:hypothetical protein
VKKRRIYWPSGNPRFDAWEVESPAGQLVARRNHPLVSSGPRQCQGWDLWLDGKHLGAVASRAIAELAGLSRRELKSLSRPACCGRHAEFTPEAAHAARSGWGGRRPNAGRPPKGEARRVRLSTTIARRTVELLDRRRGEQSRGEYLDDLIQGR